MDEGISIWEASVDFASDSDGFDLSIDYFSYDASYGPEYEKDSGDPVEYISAGITYYIMTNRGYYLAVWQYENLSSCISGVVEEQELYNMIDSIPTE